MRQHTFLVRLLLVVVILVAEGSAISQAAVQPQPRDSAAIYQRMSRKITPTQRRLAAARAAARRSKQGRKLGALGAPLAALNPGGTPDYFNVANYANSPLPTVDPTTGAVTGGIRKFVDTLPGLGAANANRLGQYIPVAVADTKTYPGSDYYQIGLVDYAQQMHPDLPATRLRGYKDLASGADGNAHYLGPLIIAQKDRPVRIKFSNLLPNGSAGNLFLPVDTTVMGAGVGPLAMENGNMELYTQNRAVLHLHGGATPWISDGTPHQWITPAGEQTSYPKGVSQQNVPDMPDPGPGSATYYYTNQQSNRFMFYHDHSYGITRLNVYAGEAAGYLLTDPVEEDLISNQKVLPDEGGVYHYGIPLIIQDKTFVPDTAALATQDPTWDTAKWGDFGNLWFPHVYMPNQNPADESGANAFGRWDYGPWFWPPMDPSTLKSPPVEIAPGVFAPGTPNPSMAMEAFMDTPLVNGAAYPVLPVERKAYRFRILNACNDRSLNLQLYYVDPANPTEVKMVPAYPHPKDPTWPATWPTDGRDGGVPDPTTAGPAMIQIGTEGGFLSKPAVLPNTPIGYNYNRRDIVVLNISNKTLFLGPAERADVIVDFSQVPDGSKIILYNDAPAPVPAFDPRYDYYTGDPDQTSTGGAPTTLPGYGPNTRTIMQFQVSGANAAPAFDLNALNAAWPAAYMADQPAPIVPEVAYGAASNTYSRIQSTSLTYTPFGSTAPVTTPMQPKAIQELFELDYGRMNSTLGVELPFTNFMTQTTIPYGYIDPPTETVQDGQVQVWKITHNGVDTHAIHFHLFNVQLINRVGWDGAIRPPDPNELGWKETVRMNPLEDAIVALKPIMPTIPFAIPDSIRPLDPTMPIGSMMGFTNVDPQGNPTTTMNEMVNFGNEYVWHCHLLGHEEMDMMRPIVMQSAPPMPTTVTAVGGNAQATVSFTTVGTGGSPITGFTATSSPDGITAAGLPTATSITVTGLTNGKTYTFTVTATNAIGTGLPSAPSNAVTPATVPDAPVIGTAVGGNAQATVSFAPPAFDGGSPITGYTATSNPDGITGVGLANATSITVTGLTNGKTYTFTVTATNAIGTGLPSAPSNAVTPATVPDAPVIGTAVGGNAQATVSFAPPAFDGGSPITGYTATSNPDGITAAGLPTATSITVTGLTNGKTYTFTVTATNAVGTGAPSAPSNAVTLGTLPGAPTIGTATVAGIGQASVSFAAPSSDGGSPIGSYTVTSNPGGKTGMGSASPIKVTGLTAGATYTFTVTATNGTGTGPSSGPSNAITIAAPVAPSKLVATPSALSTSPPTMGLTWADNSNNEDGFTIQRATNPGFTRAMTTFAVGPNLKAFTDTTVLPTTRYYYRARAYNVLGNSAWSNTAMALTAGQIPAPPTNLVFVSSTRTSLGIAWTNNTTSALAYQVERSTAGAAGPWVRIATLGSSASTFTNTGLRRNTTYWYRIRAVATGGFSTYTNVLSATTLP